MGRDTASSNNSSIELLEGTAAWGAYVLILEANRRNIYLKVDIQIWVLTLMRAEILSWREKLLAAEVEKVKFSSWQVCKLKERVKEWQKIQFTLGWKLGKSSLVLKVQGIKKKKKAPHKLERKLKVGHAGWLPACPCSLSSSIPDRWAVHPPSAPAAAHPLAAGLLLRAQSWAAPLLQQSPVSLPWARILTGSGDSGLV